MKTKLQRWRRNGRNLGGGLALGLAALAFPVSAAVPASVSLEDIRRDATVEAVQRVTPSVVNIATRKRGEVQRGYVYDWFRDQYMPYARELPPKTSAGSGLIIDEDGYIITNVHVVKDADEVEVKLWDNRPAIRAIPIVGILGTDLALLKMVTKPGEKFTAAKFAQDDDILLGETLMAMGNPFGLGASVSRGILSSKPRRELPESRQLQYADWLQTDAAINPGNSGGPLINLRGEVVGINVAVSQEGQGIGFAIPVKLVTESLSDFFSPEFRKSQWFGARLKPGELTVTSVQIGSPADKGGLKAGDQLLTINGKAPKSLVEGSDLMVSSQTNQVLLGVKRGEERKNLTVILMPLGDLIRQKMGLNLQELTPEVARTMDTGEIQGLLVSSVEKGGPAEAAGLKRGHLVMGMDGQKTGDILSIAHVLWGKKKGEAAELLVVAQERSGGLVRYQQGTLKVPVR